MPHAMLGGGQRASADAVQRATGRRGAARARPRTPPGPRPAGCGRCAWSVSTAASGRSSGALRGPRTARRGRRRPRSARRASARRRGRRAGRPRAPAGRRRAIRLRAAGRLEQHPRVVGREPAGVGDGRAEHRPAGARRARPSGCRARRRASTASSAAAPSAAATPCARGARPAGETRTSRRTRSGWRAATATATAPPSEWPTRSKRSSPRPSTSASATSSSSKPGPAGSRLAEAGDVDGDDAAPPAGERAGDVAPDQPAGGDAVQQDERVALAVLLAAESAAVDRALGVSACGSARSRP